MINKWLPIEQANLEQDDIVYYWNDNTKSIMIGLFNQELNGFYGLDNGIIRPKYICEINVEPPIFNEKGELINK